MVKEKSLGILGIIYSNCKECQHNKTKQNKTKPHNFCEVFKLYTNIPELHIPSILTTNFK